MLQRGKDGLTEDEVAFYEALSENDSTVGVMGDEKLKLIANEFYNQCAPTRQLIGIIARWHVLKYVLL